MELNFNSFDNSKQILTFKYDLTEAVIKIMKQIDEYQDKIVFKNLPQDVLENLKKRIELELLRRDKGEGSQEYILKHYLWEQERKAKGYLKE